MTRGARYSLIALGVIVAAVLLAWGLPIQQKAMDYCYGKGGMYIGKSMQCITDQGIENLFGKKFDN